MPGVNFNYTKFLKQQHEKYIQKYGEDKLSKEENPQPINGFGGYTPTYRGSVHDQKVIRSLVRCLTSPMKPTTANGYLSKSKQFFSGNGEETEPKIVEKKDKIEDKPNSAKLSARAKSAPAAPDRPYQEDHSRNVSRISVMSAGGSNYIQAMRRPATSQPQQRIEPESRAQSSRSITTPSQRGSPIKRPIRAQGYPQTLYGNSYWFDWDHSATLPSLNKTRPESYDRDRRLTRREGVIYHKHEGMVPKYMGYVPHYKFRHGSTFGVLTVNAAASNAAHLKHVKA